MFAVFITLFFSDCPTQHHRWRGDRRENSVGCFSMEYAGSSLSESCCLSLHFLSKATYLTPPLQSYYACSSITLLTTSDTVEMSDDMLLHWKWYVMFNNKIHNLVRVGLSLFYVTWLVSHMFNVWLIFIGWLTIHVMLFSLISFLNSKAWVVENSNVLNG